MADKSARKATRTGWRLVPRVQDIGFFDGLLVSRARLATAAVASTAGSLVVITLVSNWMRNTSGSPMANVFIIALMLTGLIVAAYIDALLIGDLFFPGRWRERIVQGDDFVPEDWDEEQAAVKEYNAPFFVVLICTLLALAWGSQLLTGGFLFYYQKVGFALTLMRSDDPDDRYMGLESIVNPLYEEYWQEPELHAQIAKLIDDPDPKVRQMSHYVAGRLQVAQAGDGMLEVFRDPETDGATRASAAMGLGRLGWDRSLAYLVNRLRAPDAERNEQLGIVRGLGMMKDPRGGEPLVRLLETCGTGDARLPDDLIFGAFYALREIGHNAGSEVALGYLKGEACGGDVSRQEQCAAADALRYTARDEDIDALKRAFTAAPSDFECNYEMWRYQEEKAIEIVEKEPLRAKIVRAVGNRQNYDTYEWMWNVGADESELMKTRKVAEVYVREMLEMYENDKTVRRKK